jgi:hypothetical protein
LRRQRLNILLLLAGAEAEAKETIGTRAQELVDIELQQVTRSPLAAQLL